MDTGQGWSMDLEEPFLWADDELTPEELARLYALEDELASGVVEPAAPPTPPSAGGMAGDDMADLLAAVRAASGDPALLNDAELIGSLAGWHAVAARAQGAELRTTAELLRRRRPRVWDRRADRAVTRQEDLNDAAAGAGEPERVMPAVVVSREATEEIALALTVTGYAAGVQAQLAADLTRRLPMAFAELAAGRADLTRVRVLAEATQYLSDEDAGKVDTLLSPVLGQMTTGALKDKARRVIIKIDPAAAERRKQRAERKARFALYGNDDQTATVAVEKMPAQLAAAAKARVAAIARAAKAAGMAGPMALLEAKVATGLLLDTLPIIPPPPDSGPDSEGPSGQEPGGPGSDPAGGGPDDPRPTEESWDSDWPGPQDPDVEDAEPDFRPDPGPGGADRDDDRGSDQGELPWPRIPVQAGAAGPGYAGLPAWLRPKTLGRIRLAVAWRTLAGIGPEPGDLSWAGPITPAQARELAAAAVEDPSVTWRLIVTDDDGHAIALTTLPARHGVRARAGSPGLVGEVTITIQQSMAAALQADGKSGVWVRRSLARLAGGEANIVGECGGPKSGEPALGKNFAALAALLTRAIIAANHAGAGATARAAHDAVAGGCAHTMEAAGYRVPDRLRRWLNARDRTCRNPICRQPAARCDQDHTLAHHRGGRTCTCNLGGLCRIHHQLKQLPGWCLSQDARGRFTWTTPAGLTYREEPYCYPV